MTQQLLRQSSCGELHPQLQRFKTGPRTQGTQQRRLGWRLRPLEGMQWTWPQGLQQLGWIEQGRRPSIKPAIAASSRLAITVRRHHPQRPLQRPSDLGRQQGTTALRALHQHHGLGQRHQQPISFSEGPTDSSGPWRLFRDQQAPLTHLTLKPLVMARIDPLQRGAQHRNGRAACFQTALMGLSINTFRKPTDHRPARSGER